MFNRNAALWYAKPRRDCPDDCGVGVPSDGPFADRYDHYSACNCDPGSPSAGLRSYRQVEAHRYRRDSSHVSANLDELRAAPAPAHAL
jgi:hypothetical protein